VLEAADPDTRAQLNRLRDAARRELHEHLMGAIGLGEAESLSAAKGKDILVEAAKSWLEEREQEARRQASEGRRLRHS
jgi:hypothetical protein